MAMKPRKMMRGGAPKKMRGGGMAMKPEMYMSMLDTAEVVAERYKIGRDKQDEYSLECQRRVGAALQAGRFNDEIVPFTTRMALVNKDTKEVSYEQVTLTKDEGPRPETTAEGLAKIKPVFEGKTISAGNASQRPRRHCGAANKFGRAGASPGAGRCAHFVLGSRAWPRRHCSRKSGAVRHGTLRHKGDCS